MLVDLSEPLVSSQHNENEEYKLIDTTVWSAMQLIRPASYSYVKGTLSEQFTSFQLQNTAG